MRLAWLSFFVAVMAALVSPGLSAADTPVIRIGPSTATGSTNNAAVGSGGQTDACLSDRHSGANPGASAPTGVAQIDDASCGSAASSSTVGTRTSSTSSASKASSGSGTAAAHRKTSSAPVVGANRAAGLRIASVRFASSRKELHVLVTLRDLHGALVRNAIVLLRPMSAGYAVDAGFSNGRGQVTLAIPIGVNVAGKRLSVLVTAHTPTARARRASSIRLPAV